MNPRALLRQLLNRGWMAANSREEARFKGALGHAAQTQERYLLNLLQRNCQTRFGERHGFAQIRSIAEFQKRVPIVSYEDLIPHVEAIARGETNVLTAEPVGLFQPTSGSTSATKLIPWTHGVAAEFRRAIAPWLASLYRRKPGLLRGTAYWSVSPPATRFETYGCLRVGFAHDADYLGFFGRKLFSFVNAVPADVARCSDMDEFRTRTLLHLLGDAELGLISVWSPTFLSTLLEHFLVNRAQILERLGRNGGAKAMRRARVLQDITSAKGGVSFFEEVWPRLQVISCWTHGPSEIYARNLRRFFPTVEIQGKGLLATEAFVSLPYQEGHDPVLALTSHFFEFQYIENERVCPSHELELDQDYRVIVTTGGGLYRYALGDRVRVTGFIQNTPCLRFLGREGNVSDLFGEKLHGATVESVIQRVLANQAIQARFFLLAPVIGQQTGVAYTLFLESAPAPDATRLCRELEEGLVGNFHYAHCRRLGQLSHARLFVIEADSASASAEAIYQGQMLSRGIKAGDIKPMPLDSHSGWERLFHGCFADGVGESPAKSPGP
jgi:hypothetical protein